MMKRGWFILMFLCVVLSDTIAQYVPKGINYQAIARDFSGDEIMNQNLNVRIYIIQDGDSDPVYAESHIVETDQFGLFQLVIGDGSYFAGTVDDFMDVPWGVNSHWLRVDVKFDESDGYVSMGSMQFLAVPYALYAATSGAVAGEEDNDKDPENELQVLSLEGQVLSISEGNSITLSDIVDDADADPENEIQDLQIDQDNVLTLSGDPGSIDLKTFLDNTDAQELSLDGNTLAISNGNQVSIDADPANEIQQLSREGYDISLSGGGGSVNVKPEIIAFRALKTGTAAQSAGDTVRMKFNQELLDSGDGIVPDGYYDSDKGIFVVPEGGEGLYYFDLNYKFDVSHTLLINLNGEVQEVVFDGYGTGVSGVKTYSFIYLLEDGDELGIDLVLSSGAFCGKGSFYGYRIH